MKNFFISKRRCLPIPKFDLKMKLTTLFLLVTIFALQANTSYSQKTKISLNHENVPVAEVIDDIESKTKFRFVYKMKDVDIDRRVSIKVDKARIETILKLLFKQTDTEYKVLDLQVVLREAKTTKNIPKQQASVQQDPINISGTVTDEKGNPLPGASITEKGTTNGVATDFDGNYEFKVSSGRAILIISYISYIDQEVPVNDIQIHNIQLQPDLSQLNEVVVIGYGSIRKRDLTGSVGSVKGEDLNAFPATRSDQLLQGRIAGVQVSNANSNPGGDVRIRIRGTSSINASSSPLVIVDGIIGSELEMVNPNDIQSLEVLKDASSTAIYGSRGANGVIIITTKRGRIGKTSVNYSTSYATQTVRNKLDLIDASQHAQYINEAIDSGNGNVEEENRQPTNLGKGTDWQDQIFSSAPMVNHNLSIRSGNENTQVALSLDYLNQEGIIKGSDFERGTIRLNLDQKISDKLKVSVGAYYARSGQNSSFINTSGGSNGSGITAAAIRFSPILSPLDTNGNYTDKWMWDYGDGNNPLALTKERTDLTTRDFLQASVFADYEIIKGLNLNTRFAYTSNNRLRRFFVTSALLEGSNNGVAAIDNRDANTWISETTLVFNKEFNNNHNLTVLGGFTAQEDNFFSSDIDAEDFPTESNTFNQIELSNPEFFMINSGSTQRNLLSYIGRINYTLYGKYLFQASGRYDGSSVLSEGNKYAFFPSFALGWRISDENFFNNEGLVSFLKLRGSWGEVGNQSVSPFQTFASAEVNTGDTRFAPDGVTPITTVILDNLGNPSLTWERTRQLDIGLDVELFGGKIDFTAGYYKKNTLDLLVERTIPLITGFGSLLSNVGEVENSGLEFSLGTNVNIGNVKWASNSTLSINDNKVVDLGDKDEILLNPGYNYARAGSVRLIEGEPIGAFWGYEFDGIYQTQEEVDASGFAGAVPGDVKFKDINDDGVVDIQDQGIIGNPQPDLIFSIDNTLSYKGINLNFYITSELGYDVANLTHSASSVKTVEEFNGRWRGEGTSNSWPAPWETPSFNNFSSFWLEDGSYVRLRNISLGYDFQTDLLEKLGLAALNINISGQNLITWTNYSGFDPEVNSNGNSNTVLGFDNGSYPVAKSVTLGLRASF